MDVLIYHQRRDIEGCYCGWRVLGASHAEHVVDVFESLDHERWRAGSMMRDQ